MDNLMIFGARFVIYFSFALMFVLAFKASAKEKRALILAIFSIPILVLIIKIIHIFYFEPRPFVEHHFFPLIDSARDASFPSRHAAMMAVVAFAFLLVKSKWAFLFLLLMLWVGISRIYVGVHYPWDIIGGFLTGIISIIFVTICLKLLYKRLFLD